MTHSLRKAGCAVNEEFKDGKAFRCSNSHNARMPGLQRANL